MSIEDWEPWKAMAALIGVAAVFAAGAFAIGYWIGQTPPTPIVIQLQQPAAPTR